LVPSLYLKPFSRYLHLNSECAQTDGWTDGRKEGKKHLNISRRSLRSLVGYNKTLASRSNPLYLSNHWVTLLDDRLKANSLSQQLFFFQKISGAIMEKWDWRKSPSSYSSVSHDQFTPPTRTRRNSTVLWCELSSNHVNLCTLLSCLPVALTCC